MIKFLKKTWFLLVGLLLVTVGVLGLKHQPPFGGTIPSISIGSKTINFNYTDDNSGENLIINTDAQDYTKPDVYFSIKNTTATNQNISVVFTLKDSATELSSEVKRLIPDSELVGIASPSHTVLMSSGTNKYNSAVLNENRKPVIGSNFPGFQDTILAGKTAFYKVSIIVPDKTIKQEFFIEALTAGTDYGHLDPTMTANGAAQVDTAQAKFGTGSLLTTSTGNDYLSTPDDPTFDFGSGDFTIEFFWRPNSLTAPQSFFWHRDQGIDTSYSFNWGPGGTLLTFSYAIASACGSIQADVTRTWSPSVNTWYHVELDRSGTGLYMFADGVQLGTTFNIGTDNLCDSTGIVGVAGIPAVMEATDGWIDELRITKGLARHTANFTPPSAAYTCADSNTSLLLHMDGTDGSTSFPADTTACGGGAPTPVPPQSIEESRAWFKHEEAISV